MNPPRERVTLRGLGASPGTAVGPARVLMAPAEADSVPAGCILVSRLINPYLAPLFFRIAGVVTEEGGLLQHATTLAREFGIPAVVAVADATAIIEDADLVEIRGDTGEVVVLRRRLGGSRARGPAQ